MPKNIYSQKLPDKLNELMSADMKIAFSEGMLPYFASHPEIKSIELTYSGPQEGLYSCYIDAKGYVSSSSFKTPDLNSPNIFDTKLENIWWTFPYTFERYNNHVSICKGCVNRQICSFPHDTSILYCNYQPHNSSIKPPLTIEAQEQAYELATKKLYNLTLKEFRITHGEPGL